MRGMDSVRGWEACWGWEEAAAAERREHGQKDDEREGDKALMESKSNKLNHISVT